MLLPLIIVIIIIMMMILQDTAGMAVNLYGRGCSDYYLRPEGCGEYDDDDFASNVMCCPCGGGSTYEGVDSSRSPIFLVLVLVISTSMLTIILVLILSSIYYIMMT